MVCTNCGAELSPDLKFCTSCGSQVAQPLSLRYCTSCGAQIRAESSFCPNCGTQQAAVPPAPPQPGASFRPAAATAPVSQPAYGHPAVAREMGYKGIGPRLVAAIVDTILYFAFAWFVASATGNTSSAGFDLEGAPAFLTFAVWTLYFILLEGMLGGTIGKLILGMRIVNERGENPGIGAALIRNLLRIVDFLPLFYLLGMILVATSQRKQRLGDRVAGTYVVAR